MGSRKVVFTTSIDVDLEAEITWPERPLFRGPDGDYDDPRQVEEVRGCSPRDQLLLDAINAAGELEPTEEERARCRTAGQRDLEAIDSAAFQAHDDDCTAAEDLAGLEVAIALLRALRARASGLLRCAEDEARLLELGIAPQEWNASMSRSVIPGLDFAFLSLQEAEDTLRQRLDGPDGKVPVVTWVPKAEASP